MALLSAVATACIGVFAYFSNPHRKINQTFLLLTIIIAVWQLNIFMGMGSLHDEDLHFWVRGASAYAALIPALMNLNRLSILYPHECLRKLILRNKYWLIPSFLIILLCQSSWFLEDVLPPTSVDVLPTPIYGPGFLVFSLYFLVSLALLISFLVKSNRSLKGARKAEIEYMLLSYGTGLFIGVFFLIVPFLTKRNDLSALLPLSVIAFSSITGYGIATKGILGVPVVARRIIAYTMLILYLISLYYLVLSGSKHFLIWLNQSPAPIAHLLATFALVFSVSPAHGMAQRLANRLFINTPPLNVGTILREAGSSLNSVLTVDELCSRFHQILKEKLETRDLTILIRQNDRFVQIYPLNEFHRKTQETRLPELIGEDSRLFVRDLLQRHKLTPHTRQIFQELQQENAAAAISLTRNGNLLGLLLLGERSSGRLYAHEEALAVEGLRDLFSVSYENARLYTELQNSRIYMDLLLKNLVSGVIATDSEGTITTCNHEAGTILRMDPDQIANTSIHNLPPPLESLLQQVFETDQVVRDREIILPRDGQGPLFLNVGAALFHDLENSVLGGLMVLQDRTAIRVLEDQVKRSERLASLGTLSAGMAHEIKNPLVTLKTFTQLLPERFEDPDFRETFSALAGKEIGRIDTLVNQLLSFARPAKPKLDSLHLHDLLKSHIKWFRQQAADQEIEIEEHYAAERDVVLADDDQLRQVFLNLLLNAQQVMSEGGTIAVRTRISGIYLQVAISDTGKGIHPDDLDHVFDPFFTTKSSGTGLGLAVAHQILTEHNAEIRVASQLEKGSTFDLYFPLHQPDSLS